MPAQLIRVEAPACDDSGWVVRTQEKRGSTVSEQLHWYEDEHSAEEAYSVFLERCQLYAATG